ncbi:DUF726 domain-containing protein [Vibrio cyclitrophicus]
MRTRVIRAGKDLKVIVINGFMSEQSTDVTDWLSVVDKNFPKAAVLHCDWDASNYKRLVTNWMTPEFEKPPPGGLLLKIISQTIVGLDLFKRKSAIGATRKEWITAMENAKLAGMQLANYIDKNPSKYILMGHSLGSRVIFNCLVNMKTYDRVMGAFLLGGAVGAESPWGNIAMRKSIRIFNCYSDNDMVLRGLYRAGTLFSDTPVGIKPIEQGYKNQIFNINMSRIVRGHTDYKKAEVGNLIKTYTSVPR